ncbi:MAG: hypothetical protein WKF71_04810 [Pyrinomonadaceae bacterium]
MATTARDLGGLYADSVSTSKIWQVIGASSVGTMIEWYDFYIFGSLGRNYLAAILPARQRYIRIYRLLSDVCRRALSCVRSARCFSEESAILSGANTLFW